MNSYLCDSFLSTHPIQSSKSPCDRQGATEDAGCFLVYFPIDDPNGGHPSKVILGDERKGLSCRVVHNARFIQP
jgi:hypothetical protein